MGAIEFIAQDTLFCSQSFMVALNLLKLVFRVPLYKYLKSAERSDFQRYRKDRVNAYHTNPAHRARDNLRVFLYIPAVPKTRIPKILIASVLLHSFKITKAHF